MRTHDLLPQVMPQSPMELWSFGTPSPGPDYAASVLEDFSQFGNGHNCSVTGTLSALNGGAGAVTSSFHPHSMPLAMASGSNGMGPGLSAAKSTRISVPNGDAAPDMPATAAAGPNPNGVAPLPATAASAPNPSAGGPPAAATPFRVQSGWQTPSAVLLPRFSIFYTSTFARHAGLPGTNVLRDLQGKKLCSRVLYSFIFNTIPGQHRNAVHNPSNGTGAAAQGSRTATSAGGRGSVGLAAQRRPTHGTATLPQPAVKVPKSHAGFCGFLRLLIKRANKCPYGLLLKYHCPMPAWFSSAHAASTESSGSEPPILSLILTPPGAAAAATTVRPDTANNRHSSAAQQHATVERAALPHPNSSKCLLATTQAGSWAEERCSGGPAAEQAHASNLASAYVPHKQVAGFIWSAVRHIVPSRLMGSSHNRARLRKTISAYIALRRHEQMSLHTAIQGLKPSEFPWMAPPGVEKCPKLLLPPECTCPAVCMCNPVAAAPPDGNCKPANDIQCLLAGN